MDNIENFGIVYVYGQIQHRTISLSTVVSDGEQLKQCELSLSSDIIVGSKYYMMNNLATSVRLIITGRDIITM